MEPPSGASVNPNHPDVEYTNETPLSPPTSLSAAPSVSMLNNTNNARIKNSAFYVTTNYTSYSGSAVTSSLDLLHKSVAPNAILNSGGRADEVGCYPGTREEVIGQVEKSIAQVGNGPRMLWLSGPAGAGKSAIMQTVAERCEKRGIPQANFFFFREDSSRNNAGPLVATLMHQIVKLYPSIGPAVAVALASDPLIFRMDLQKQFDELIHQTPASLQESPSTFRPLTLLIDGLDECDSKNKTRQRQLLQALDKLLMQRGLYFRVVIASRVEPQISMTFSQLCSQVDSIFLDEKYSPENDIRLFVTAEFKKIKSTHYLSHTLAPDWPSQSDITGIVSKSSGQFIFAAVVMGFIAHSPSSPILSLQKVQGIVPPAKHTPFAQLDAVYTYILEQVDDPDAVKAILALRIIGVCAVEDIKTAMEAYHWKFSGAVFDSCVSELTPLLNIRHRGLEFFHASFPDFLQDRTRAGEYYVDIETLCMSAIPIWWLNRSHARTVFSIIIKAFEHVRQPTPELTEALMKPHPLIRQNAQTDLSFLLWCLERIYYSQDVQSFSKIMRKWSSVNSTVMAQLMNLFSPDP